MNDSLLIVGATYFRVTYADRDLTMPGLEPLVFIGEVEMESGEQLLAFQDTVSYVRFGSGLDATRGTDEVQVSLVPSSEFGSGIFNLQQAASAVSAAAQRAKVLGHPVLLVVRDGWVKAH